MIVNFYHLGQLVAVRKTSCGREAPGSTQTGWIGSGLKGETDPSTCGVAYEPSVSPAVGWITMDERGLGRDSLGG